MYVRKYSQWLTDIKTTCTDGEVKSYLNTGQVKDCLSVIFDPLENNSLILGQKKICCNFSWQQVIDTIMSGWVGGNVRAIILI